MQSQTPINPVATERFPFIFGAHYYRAPAPEPECWEDDFRAMRALGFNETKLFVQWRWSHRAPDRFYFDDLDRLMDLAATHGIGVTLNLLLDMSPLWLYEQHADARQIDIRGRVIEPAVVGHRAIGGHPGPCYNHPGARADRQSFVAKTVEHFRDHPAMHMWDVWNEPELCFFQRTPDMQTLACYCEHCRRGFIAWLQRKHGDIERVNEVWGRPYERWEQVEMPRNTGGITDFIHWREFHLETLAEEAVWRLNTVKELDPHHGRYLHVVPNTWFNAVTCVDDFAMADACEIFAATMNGGPSPCQHIISAARGKVCYNVESHLNYGSADQHQQIVDLPSLLADFLPQIGQGIKGFLFWQYRPEVLGLEAPAWGLVQLDGSPRPVTEAACAFWTLLQPHAGALRETFPAPAEIGIWRSRKNEIFHFCLQGAVTDHNAAIDAYLNALYWDGYACRIISGEMLAAGALDGLRLLIMPMCYYLTQAEADALDRWVRAGGVLLCEAHLGGYNGTTGRHSRRLPGCGLANSWGLREMESTSACHLRISAGAMENGRDQSEDVSKAKAAFGAGGGRFFPIRHVDGTLLQGAHRYAELTGKGLEALAAVDGAAPCVARLHVGQGTVIYCGTNFGLAACEDAGGLLLLLRTALSAANVAPIISLQAERLHLLHIDLLYQASRPRFAVVAHRGEEAQQATFARDTRWRGLFSEITWEAGNARVEIPAGFHDLFYLESGS